jgi:hypothetical protein
MSPARSEEMVGQVSGYWIEDDRPTPSVQPRYKATGAFLPRREERAFVDFLCLDLVLVPAGDLFVWMPLSEAGQYTYAHSLGLIYGEPWRLAVWNDQGSVLEYAAEYAESIPARSSILDYHYGAEAETRARQDRPTVQLHLRRIS